MPNIKVQARSRTCYPIPKPSTAEAARFIPAVPDAEIARIIRDLAPSERRALHKIAEEADLLEIEGQTWLLAPIDAGTIDVLAQVGAETDDMENDLNDEQECEDEGAQCDDEGAIETDLGAAEDESGTCSPGAW